MDDLDFSQISASPVSGDLSELVCRYLFEDEAGVAPAIFWVDPDADFQLIVASSACRHWGVYTEAESSKALHDCIPTLSREKLLQLWEQIDTYGKTFLETEYSLSSGRRIAIEILFSRARHEHPLMAGIIRDITERRVLEAERQRLAIEVAQKEAELRFREIFDNVTDGVFLLDVVGTERFRFSAINPAMARITGIVPSDVAGRFVEDVLPQHSAAIMIENYRRCVENESPTQYEAALDFPAGRRILDSMLVPVRNDKGNIYRIIGLTSDITARKHAEREIGFMNFSLDQMQDAVFLVDAQQRFRYVNQCACDTLGYTRQELLGLSVADVDAMNVADDTAIDYRSKQSHHRFETQHRTKFGKVFPVEISSSLIEYGDEVMHLAVARDISRRKAMEDELRWQAEFQKSLLDAIYDVGMQVLVVEDERVVHVGNRSLARQYGFSDSELDAPIELARFIHPDDLAKVYEYQRRRRVGLFAPPRYEVGIITKSGRRLEYDVAVAVVPGTSPVRMITVGQDISRRKQAEEQLRTSEEQMRLFFEHQAMGMAITTPDKRWIKVNDKVCEMLGYQREELLGLTWEDITHPDDMATDTVQFNRMLSGEIDSYQVEKRHRRKDGQYLHANLAISCVRRVDGALDYVLAVMEDMSGYKLTQHRLELFRTRLLTVLNTMPDYVWLKDVEGTYLACNHAFERFFGAPEAEIIGKTDHDFVDAELADFFRDKDRVAMDAGRVCVNEEWITLADDGREVLLETRKVPVYDESGRINGVLGLARDITELRQRDEQLALLDYALDHVSDALYLIDIHARFIRVNDAACRMLGYSREELLKLSVYDIDPDFGPEQWAETIQMFDSGQQYFFINTRHRRQNGAIIDVEVHANYIVYQGKQYNLALVRDVTARKEAEALLVRRESELRRLVENVSQSMVRLDRNFRRTFVNSAYMSFSGVEQSRILGSHVSEFWRAHNITPDQYIEALSRVMNTGQAEDVILERDPLSEGFYSHLVRLAPEFTSEGTVQGVIALGFDMTERRRQEFVERQRLNVMELVAENVSLDTVLKAVEQFIETCRPGSACCIQLPERVPADEIGAIRHAGQQEHIKPVVLSPDRYASPATAEMRCSDDCNREPCSTAGQYASTELVKSMSGELVAAITLYHDRQEGLSEMDFSLLKQASNLVAIAIERKRLEERMEQQASFDPLTGLPNRRLFGIRLHEEVRKAERNNTSVALLFIDLDHFKEVNDTLGHDIGDRLLIEAAARIRQCVRASDAVARLGGDEFVVTIVDAAETDQIARLSQQIVDAVSRPFSIDNNLAYVSASVGIACYPDDGEDLKVLVSRADQAMYAAKAQGRNGYCFFTTSMQEQAQYRTRIANDLRNALHEGQLEVHYQPIVDAGTGRVIKAEALLRWHHPTLGYIRPDVFIPLAEENGSIHDIGDWVFRQAAMLARRWRQQVDDAGNSLRCQVSVNISPRQFSRGKVESAWIAYLQYLELDPASIAVEITEGLLLDDRADIIQRLKEIRDTGMEVSLDDFGTGYSAMSYLKKFSLDYLKIDRSFVRDLVQNPNDRAIAEAIIVMAHKLGLKTIAEGVETTEQRELLKSAGCEYIQGYLYAKPVPEHEFLGLVESMNMTAMA
ncbi:uncharacterized protein NMK_2234 [Novimethylophilus kurashikiensis]|uniref:Diguanylate cyclase n=1 Tax=Novimethylophilus kurashikiensis TaxID=1825523 RepID=A0A2R5F9C0_9PROT|nr:PAS domain S-box protein [Novimethylophilus kurashikiensis]GBG14635.1 uncharacterized protein NMK_2234 [Novimethylophilus kurashikiensis]